MGSSDPPTGEHGGAKKDPSALSPDKSTLLEQAEMRTTQANLGADQANTRTDEANTRTEQANARTAEANTRTQQADLRTEKATTTSDALHASELSYRRLFESARDGILILNADTGRITDVNPFLVELLGYSHGNMVGKTVGELSPFRDILSNQAMLERLQEDGYIRYEDLPLETCDGRRISVEFVSNVYQAGDKQVIQCNIRDITERKRTEGALKKSESRYHSLFDNMLEGYAYCRTHFEGDELRDFTYLEVNGAFEKLTGLEDVVGKKISELVPGIREANADLFKLYGRVVLTGRPERVETFVVGLDVWLSITIYSSERESFVGVFENITERKQAEDALYLVNSAVLQARDSILITDAQLDLPGPKIVFVNPAFSAMTGYAAGEVIGKTPRILQGPKTNKTLLRQLRQNLERGEIFEGEGINYRKDGKEFNLEWHIAPIRNASGAITHFVAIQRDVTAQKSLESQLRQSQKMEAIGTLAGGVAHDFNNILAIIQMQAELLKSGGDLSAKQAELADDIGNVVQRAVTLTRQLLVFSSREVLQPRDLDLNQNVTEMAKMLTRILGENIEVQLKLAEQPMLLHADAGLVDQVLMNLAVNARDAMPEGGQLIIETAGVEFDEFAATQTVAARPGSFVRLSVSDNGSGTSPENLPRIFDPYFTTKSVGKGTGLGLATVFGIAQQHHGWINVYSEVGRGTTFKVYLPRLPDTHDPEITPEVKQEAPQSGHEIILLVEDEPELRATMKMTLAQLGYRVLEASTGASALDVWKEHHDEIHLLLTDLVMPDGMTGKELGQRLLQEEPKLKVIYMSGYSAEIVAKDFPLQEGVNFLSKPFRVQQLAQTIRQILDAPVVTP